MIAPGDLCDPWLRKCPRPGKSASQTSRGAFAAELVPVDVVKLFLGAVVAADVKLTAGEVLLDQAMLTGESVPIEAGAGVQTYAGALVRRGEAVAEVTANGARTKFGRTTELVRTARVVSSQQKAVISPGSTASSSFCWSPMRGFSSCRSTRSSPLSSRRCSHRYRLRCRPPSLLRRRSARGPWQSKGFYRPASRRWMKRRR
jgi:E1-E2 ATPase